MRGGRRGTIPKMSENLRKSLLADPLDARAYGSTIGKIDVDEGLEVGKKQSQWLNMDVRNLDANVLGQSVSRPFSIPS
jgi:hypothetical protein